jgi:hypothetical protein
MSLDNPFPADSGTVTLSPNAIPPHYVDTYAESWNLGFQRQIPGRILVEAAYVGNHTSKAQRLRNLNQPVNGIRPYAGFANIFLGEQAGNSVYHSLQIRAERRLGQGLAFKSYYTWGHAIDDRPGQGGPRIQNNYDFESERADADFDTRHRWSFSAIYELPIGPGRRFGSNWPGAASALLGGWELSGIAIIQGGRPFTIFLDRDISGTGNRSDRPDRVAGVSLKPDNQGPDNWINRAAFTLPATGSFGTAGRNIGRGPQLHNLDLALIKAYQAGDNTRLQFRVEMFNALNHPNFGFPVTSFDNPSFGAINSTVTTERQIQLGIRIEY